VRRELLIPMKETIVKITPHDLMRMKAVIMDADRDAALDVVKDLLNRAEAASRGGLKNHLDN
jgi:hypothetical protein